jgi:2-dehydro-3-deoxyglucarate aldolase
MGIADAQSMYQAIKSGNRRCIPLVRLPEINESRIKRHLDAGAGGIIVPSVKSPNDVKKILRSVNYPPKGTRGVGYARSNLYGTKLSEQLKKQVIRPYVCIQIEHVDAVKNIESLLSFEDLDAVMIGPYDLSASLGIPGNFSDGLFRDTIKTVESAVHKHDIRLGTHIVKPNVDEAIDAIDKGYNLIAYSLDITVVSQNLNQDLNEITAHLKKTNK